MIRRPPKSTLFPYTTLSRSGTLSQPLSETGFPQRQRLQCRRLARIVGPNENHGLAQFDLNVVKAFEVLDSQTCKHCDDGTSLQPRSAAPSPRIIAAVILECPYTPPAKCSTVNAAQAIAAAAGIVITQAHRILAAIPHRTACSPVMLDTPAIAPEIACVVETGSPRRVASNTAIAAPVSAQNPLRGRSRVRLPPLVRTIRHPPLSVPSAMATYAASMTHNGISKFFWNPDVTSTPVINPMVFCASFDPCARLNIAAEINCSLRKYTSIFAGLVLRKIQNTATINRYADTMPINGAQKINSTVNGHCPMISPSIACWNPLVQAACAIAAPAYPPISACDELVGSPHHHVIRSHAIAPRRAARITHGVTRLRFTNPLPTVLATAVPNTNAAAKLKNAAHSTACSGVSTRVATIVAIELAAS